MNGKGVYRSNNNGADWEQVYDSAIYELSDVIANASSIAIANGVLGVIRSIDKGQTWATCNEGFSDHVWEARGVALSGDTLYMTGYYRWSPGVGIWKRSAFPAGIPKPLSYKYRLEIHPNPASDQIFVCDNSGASPGMTFSIFDINGKIVKEGIIGDNGNISVADLGHGFFIIIVRFQSEQYTGQFIRK